MKFHLASANLIQRPLEALLDPSIDAVIMANGPETEYLLRLAQKNSATVPIILLLDEFNAELSALMEDYGAQDYLIRGQLQDQLVHRILHQWYKNRHWNHRCILPVRRSHSSQM